MKLFFLFSLLDGLLLVAYPLIYLFNKVRCLGKYRR